MLLRIDQGTTGTTCLVLDEALRTQGRGYREVAQHYPRPGWVEQDPDELWESVLAAAADALEDAGAAAADLTAIGITNQRETTIVWNRASGEPAHRAIVWQDRRTAERCKELPADLIRDRTGLVPDPYFSATKLEWILSEASGDLAFGTVDSWLIWKLTGGAVHATDVSNASRTLLLDLTTLDWDNELLELFGVPRSVLRHIVDSSGTIGEAEIFGALVPIAGAAGDQQAALFGQACFGRGQAKATFGTGAFLLANSGSERSRPRDGASRRSPGGAASRSRSTRSRARSSSPARRCSGSVTRSDSSWTPRRARRSRDRSRTTAASTSCPPSPGSARRTGSRRRAGSSSGISGGTRREHLVRAALEAAAFQTRDVVDALPLELQTLRADGGAAGNEFLMQLLADLTRLPVEVPEERETTALGAAALAGLAVGLWNDTAELAGLWRSAARYEPELPVEEADGLLGEWRVAVKRALLLR